MIRALWRNFLTGLLVIFPALITLFVVDLLMGWTYRLILNPLERMLLPAGIPPGATLLARGAILVGFVLTMALLGFATRVLVVRRSLALGERLVRRVPMVGKIYWTVREIANTFVGQRRGVFTEVVLLEWPREGMYAVGFITSEGKGQVQEKTPEHIVHVFVPTTPNPTSGYLVLAPEKYLTRLDLSVEEGMRLVVSGGVSGGAYSKKRGGSLKAPRDS